MKRNKKIKTVSSNNLPEAPCINTANSPEFVPTSIDGPTQFSDPLNQVFDFIPNVQNKYKTSK